MMTRAYFSRLVISTQYVDLPLSGLKRHTAFAKPTRFHPRERGRSRLGFGGLLRVEPILVMHIVCYDH